MTAPWMLYCVAVSALLGVAAAALERALHAFGRPIRWAWAGAVLLSVTLPLTLRYAPGLRALLSPPAVEVALGAPLEEGMELLSPAVEPRTGLAALAERADALLFPAWAGATLLLLAGLGGALVALRLRRRGWRRGWVAGAPVLVSGRTGPAVVGLFRGEIVLPEWALGWDEERQRLMVEHEREHLRARDPVLLFAGLLAAVLVPWNVALWWQLRRLRLGVEVDCDARVLRRRPDVRSYGVLLLEVGRLASSGRLPATALSEPPTLLERRIRMMTSPTTGRRLRRTAFAAGVCALAAVAAGALPVPAQPRLDLPAFPADTVPTGRAGVYEAAQVAEQPVLVSGPKQSEVLKGLGGREGSATDTIPPSTGTIDVAQATVKPELQNREQVARLLEQYYPPLLRGAGISGSAMVRFVVDEAGAPRGVEVASATHEAFGEAAARVIGETRFTPAKKDGRAVAVRITMPVTFSLPRVGEPVSVAQAPDASAIREALRRHHPDLAALAESAVVWFVVNARGEVVSTGVERTGPAAGSAGDPGLRRAGFLRELDPARIERIDVLKGPAAGLEAGGGVVWVRLKDG